VGYFLPLGGFPWWIPGFGGRGIEPSKGLIKDRYPETLPKEYQRADGTYCSGRTDDKIGDEFHKTDVNL
jgi:hypothetical protein